MRPLRLLSASEQVAAHLGAELERGRWSGTMPGVNWLAAELAVSRKTAKAALLLLERQGQLAGQGQGSSRLILKPGGKRARPMRLGLLLYEPGDLFLGYIVELQHALAAVGHTVTVPAKSLIELGMDVARIRRLVQETEADAWVVQSASREVLEWFSAQPVPAMALFGRQTGLAIAGARPDKVPAMAAAVRHLVAHGHRRIVLLARRDRRLPEPGRSEQAFLDELKAQGLAPGGSSLPDWEETIEGFRACLDSLFRVTPFWTAPPTALIIDVVPLFAAAVLFLATRGIRVPQQVSLISTDPDPTFMWCSPAIAHLRWDTGPVIRRIVRWAEAVSRGRQDTRQTVTPAEFIHGGTVGPVGKG